MALKYLPPERLQLLPDCGMKHLRREVAWLKLAALVAGAVCDGNWGCGPIRICR
jgi:methionine synthase II (cobalamin-independent)